MTNTTLPAVTSPSVINEFGQAIGTPLAGWAARPHPPRTALQGRFCRVEPYDAARHADDLYSAFSLAPDGRDWTYLSAGPFDDAASFRVFAEQIAQSDDPLHYAIIDAATGRAVGSFALMRIDRANGVIELGWVTFSRLLQRTPIATEAVYLIMKRVFEELGYRRFEWKCDSLNAPSRAAALRYGFRYEGLFRQAIVYKGRTRDTTWFSIIDGEWPAIRSGFENWLATGNFDASGNQRHSLAELIAAART